MTKGEEIVLLEIENDLIYKQLQKLGLLQPGNTFELSVSSGQNVCLPSLFRKLMLKLATCTLLPTNLPLWEIF